MKILNEDIQKRITGDILPHLLTGAVEKAGKNILLVINVLYELIPEKNRISYGRVHTVKVVRDEIYRQLQEKQSDVFSTATRLFDQADDSLVQSVALGLISSDTVDGSFYKALPYFQKAASSDDFDVREMAQMFFRPLIKKYPAEAKRYLLKQVKSDDPKARRFVSETLRPVCENKWFYENPDYSLSVIKHLFREKERYPRTSVGNNLSDLARNLPELVYRIVKELVAAGDKNSYWIATRACRNLVKKDKSKVMKLLKTDHYKYKDREYSLDD